MIYSEKEEKIEELVTEIALMHDLLEESLKFQEYEYGRNCHNVLISEKISEKILELFNLF